MRSIRATESLEVSRHSHAHVLRSSGGTTTPLRSLGEQRTGGALLRKWIQTFTGATEVAWTSPLRVGRCLERLQRHCEKPGTAFLLRSTGGDVAFQGSASADKVTIRQPSRSTTPFPFVLTARLTEAADGGTLLRGTAGISRNAVVAAGLFLLLLSFFGRGLSDVSGALVRTAVLLVLYAVAVAVFRRSRLPAHLAYFDATLRHVADFEPTSGAE